MEVNQYTFLAVFFVLLSLPYGPYGKRDIYKDDRLNTAVVWKLEEVNKAPHFYDFQYFSLLRSHFCPDLVRVSSRLNNVYSRANTARSFLLIVPIA